MVTHIFMQNKNLKQIFKWPTLIGLLTTYGLVAALMVDGGYGEYLAITSLLVPVVAMIYFYWIKK
jgi:Na+/alanine symporter